MFIRNQNVEQFNGGLKAAPALLLLQNSIPAACNGHSPTPKSSSASARVRRRFDFRHVPSRRRGDHP